MKCIFVSDINGMPERGGELAGHLPEEAQICCLTLSGLALAPGLTGGGLHCDDLTCLSSTRLRDETKKPLTRTHVIFDHADASPANTVSARRLPDSYYLTGNQGHTA